MIRSSSTADRLVLLLVVAGVALLTVGAALVFLPAGLIVLGVASLAAAYVVRFVEVQSASS